MGTAIFAHWFRALTAALSLVLVVGSLHAASLAPKDEKSVRSVVEGQLAAFAADDAAKAFSYAAPNVRKSMVSAKNFMAMVRENYAVVYRPAAVAFFKPEAIADGVVQAVQLTDDDDVQWMAFYTLQRQKNKLWRITGCVVRSATGRMA
jgi:hypothetical protein